jgi:hypothetical protein
MPSIRVWRHSEPLRRRRQRCLHRLGLGFSGRRHASRASRGEILNAQYLELIAVVLYIYCFILMFLCRSVAESWRDLGAQDSPSRKRSPDPKVVVDSLANEDGHPAARSG